MFYVLFYSQLNIVSLALHYLIISHLSISDNNGVLLLNIYITGIALLLLRTLRISSVSVFFTT